MTSDTTRERDATEARSDETTLDRRAVLAATAGVGVAGVAGCLGGGGSDDGDGGGDTGTPTPTCADAPVAVEGSGGTTHCVAPVESDRSVREYYGYGRGESDSASPPDELEVEDAIVTFVYRNAASGERSLVFVNGKAASSSDGGGKAPMTFEGVSGYEWQVQDGPPGTGSGDEDPYETPDGAFGESESVLWGWSDSKTDGGAFGPLGESFDVTAVSLAEGTVAGRTGQRNGVAKWLFVDGSDLKTVELATFGEDTGDISVRVFAPGG